MRESLSLGLDIGTSGVKALLDGVRIEDPDTTRIDAGAEIGAGTLLRPFTFVGAGARVGRNCSIGPHAHVPRGTVVPDGTTVA